MREYKPIRTEMWRILSRKKQMGRLILLQYLNWYELWSINKGTAKVFYNQHSVESAITVMRFKDKKKSEEDF